MLRSHTSLTILAMRRRARNRTDRLRRAVESLPRRTREAMLRGIDTNPIVVGAYVDPRSGGICPMLAAHRNGGRTSVASFARSWDAYTGARRPRRASRREVGTLRALLEYSLGLHDDDVEQASIAELAAQIRAEREQLATGTTRQRPGGYLDLLAVAEQTLAEQGSWERTVQRPTSTPVAP